MSIPGRSLSTESSEMLRQTKEAVVKMLDLSINAKSNLMRCVVEEKEALVEDKTVFCSVFDYLHHADWRVMVPDDIKDHELRLVEKIRGNPGVVSGIIESCHGSILKEVDLIHQLNCELFFAKVDEAKIEIIPAYYEYTSSDALHKAIVNGDVSNPKEVPEKVKPDMAKHIETRTLWAKRKNPKAASCKVKAVLHFDGEPKEFITFHSEAS